MRKLIYIYFLIATFSFFSCKSSRVTNDVDCLRKVNTIVSEELRKEFKGDYDSVKKDIKIMMKFYVNKNGKADSIVFARSNLKEKDISEKEIISGLMKQSYKCICEVYYSHKPNPDYVTIIYNPDLSN